MRAFHYCLSPSRINNAKSKLKGYKLTDGGGLYVEINPSGLKTWRYQYWLEDARQTITIGKYPEIGVADARDRHFEFRRMVVRGINPAEIRRRELTERRERLQLTKGAADDFEAFSRSWLKERMGSKSATYRKQIESLLERFVWPEIGSRALQDVKPMHVLRIIEAKRDTPGTAERIRTVIQQVFNYAIQKLVVEVNPALPLRGVIEVPRAIHHRHLDDVELGRFWCSLAKQGAHFVTIAAAKILFYTMLRKGEVVRAKWTEFDLDRGIWDVPAERMKMKQSHRVCLSTQAVAILNFLWSIDARKEYVFPSVLRPGTPLGECTLNHLFKRLDFGVGNFAPHGTRSTGATLLREHGYSREVVELLLAHAERGSAIPYHRHQLVDERRNALQYLADEIDRLAVRSNV